MPTTTRPLDRDELRDFLHNGKSLHTILAKRQEVLDGVAAFEMGVDDYEAGRTYDGDSQTRESDYRDGWEFAKDKHETNQRQAWSKALNRKGKRS